MIKTALSIRISFKELKIKLRIIRPCIQAKVWTAKGISSDPVCVMLTNILLGHVFHEIILSGGVDWSQVTTKSLAVQLSQDPVDISMVVPVAMSLKIKYR